MTVLHTGWSKKFGAGWDSVFGGKKNAAGKSKARPAAAASKKKSAKKQRTTKKVQSKR